MGQTSSRYQRRSNEDTPSSPSSPAVAASSSAAQPESPSDTTPESSIPPRSRRSSLRKNIISLVKPSTSRNRTTSQSSNSGDYKRSWRNSRRWSKAPLESTCPVIVEPPTTSSSDNTLPGPSNVHSVAPDKGKQREILTTTEEDDQDSDNKALGVSHDALLSSPPGLPDADSDRESSNAESSHTAPDALYSDSHPDGDGILPQWPELEPGYTDLDLPAFAPIRRESGLPDSIAPAQEQFPTQPGTRPFPPPGTLVVVQGIVHTTDVANSRPGDANGTQTLPSDSTPSQSNSSSPSPPRSDGTPENTTGRVRNRLSTLLRSRSTPHGPNSGQASASNSMSRLATPEPNTSIAASPALSNTPSRAHSTTPPIDETHRTTQDPPPNTNQQLPTADTPSISSSSIDVLGTLLSVAAAATAASLLTGSSEPILSSGLAPTGTNSSPQIPHTSPAAPSIADPPSYSGVLPASEPPMPDVSAAGRAERMREAWVAIRQRLGLRSSGAPAAPEANNTIPSQSPNPESAPPVSGLGSLTDTRELMLAEMARAFNIGLGLNGLGGLTPNTAAAAPPPLRSSSSESLLSSYDDHDNLLRPRAQATSVAAVPPEGSFERFLVDLQVDLRVALTQGPPHTEGQRPGPPTENPTNPTTTNVTDPTLSSTETNPPTNNHPTRPDTQQPNDQDDHDNLPDLQDVENSDSDNDSDNEDDDDEDYQSADHGSAPGHMEPTLPHTTSPPSGTHIDVSGRINWWRLYRFPPIPPPRADLTGSRPPVTGVPIQLAQHVNPSHVHNAELVEPTQPPVPEQTTETSQPQGSLAPAPPSTVVPVIVVGLQSVDTDWRHEEGDNLNDDTDLFSASNPDAHAAGTNFANAPTSDDMDGLGQPRSEPGSTEPANNSSGRDGPRPGRTRGWHTRAANALRNLRPGRRTADASTGAPTSTFLPGSRTFLIYVIGGYYPPDHSIVTGGPNILDSFEALLELADLLGQVKPPTATKDDLEKSGLEIIKASEVPQHEKDGKISSNCTDRCLICLDDYEPEDQVRVMSCRHAFHKGCVDEWLLKGRNNCPACRSTGVNTENQLPSQQVSEAH